jgi:CelD/BcsL family acetyltransferase involved in cellulose biosynthesis
VLGTESGVDDILVYHHEDRRIVVENSACTIKASSLAAFRDWAFAESPATSIHLSMFALDGVPPARSWCHRLSNDAVVQLPGDMESYLAGLGRETRYNSRRYRRRIEKEHPGVAFATTPGATIEQSAILRIIDLNRARMLVKGHTSGIDEQFAQRLVLLMRECGLVVTATVEGTIIGGALLSHVDNDYFLHVIAHDDEFGKYGPGRLCLVQAITDLIDRGGERFHLLWGEYDYKTQLGAVDTSLYSLVLYRHRRSLVHSMSRRLAEKAARRAGLRRLLG